MTSLHSTRLVSSPPISKPLPPPAPPTHSILLYAVSGLCLSHLGMHMWSKTARGSNFIACSKKMKRGSEPLYNSFLWTLKITHLQRTLASSPWWVPLIAQGDCSLHGSGGLYQWLRSNARPGTWGRNLPDGRHKGAYTPAKRSRARKRGVEIRLLGSQWTANFL